VGGGASDDVDKQKRAEHSSKSAETQDERCFLFSVHSHFLLLLLPSAQAGFTGQARGQ
jgi:hypothetical protein